MNEIASIDASSEHIGGPAAARVGATAAALCAALGGRSADEWAYSGAAVTQAELLQTRLTRLADDDAIAYIRARDLLSRAVDGDEEAAESQEERDDTLHGALYHAAEVPLQIAEAAADVAGLAAWLVEDAVVEIRADAAVASTLAEAASIAAAHLVSVNLSVRGDDALSQRAEYAVHAAGQARRRAMA